LRSSRYRERRSTIKVHSTEIRNPFLEEHHVGTLDHNFRRIVRRFNAGKRGAAWSQWIPLELSPDAFNFPLAFLSWFRLWCCAT
jgi:hypothetical protein